MAEQKFQYLTRDPENVTGHDFLRDKYSLPKPNLFKYGRSQGGISNIELEKLGIGSRKKAKAFQAKRILPKNYRDDPFADPPPITESDIKDGMLSLLNRGIIPKDVDLTPAFERGAPPLMNQTKRLAPIPEKKGHYDHKKHIEMEGKRKILQSSYTGTNKIPDSRDQTFLTSMARDELDVRDMLNSADGQPKSRKKQNNYMQARAPKQQYPASYEPIAEAEDYKESN